MKDIGVIFNGEMVRAIMREFDPKTITRRTRNLDEFNADPEVWTVRTSDTPGVFTFSDGSLIKPVRCPYGAAGGRLWVRETFRLDAGATVYAADGAPRVGRWTPAIHMPRFASRVTLELLKVRVERLHEITEADARAEGVMAAGVETGRINAASQPEEIGSYVLGFKEIWETINGAESWDANPWVWAMTFRKV